MTSHDASTAQSTSTGFDEPKTPMWLPALGIVLFLIGGVYWLVTREPASPSADDAPAAAEQAPQGEPAGEPAGDPHGH